MLYIPLKINFLLSAKFNCKSSVGIMSLSRRENRVRS